MPFPPSISIYTRFRRWLQSEGSFNRRLIGSTILGFCAVIVLGMAFLHIAIEESKENGQRTTTLEIARQASQIEKTLTMLEVSHRVYLITRQDKWKTDLDKAQAIIHPQLDTLAKVLPPSDASVTENVRADVRRWVREAISLESGNPVVPADAEAARTLIEQARERIARIAKSSQAKLDNNGGDGSSSAVFEMLIYTPQLETAVGEMAKSVYGYLLSGSPESLDHYRTSRDDFYAYHGFLCVLAKENPAQRKILDEIKTTIEQWQRDVAAVQIRARQNGSDGRELAQREDGMLLVQKAQAQVVRLEALQEALYDQVVKRSKITRITRTAGMAIICVVAITLLLASSFYSFLAFRRHLQKLSNGEAQTQAIIENTLDAVITMDQQGMVLSVNPAAEEMFVQPASQILGKSISKLIPQRLFVHDIAEVERGTIVAMGQRQNYYPFPIEISFNQLSQNNRKTFVALIRDVSERSRADETLKSIGLGVTSATGEEFIRSLIKQLSKALKTDFAFIVQCTRDRAEVSSTLLMAEGEQIKNRPNPTLEKTMFEDVLKQGYKVFADGVCQHYPDDKILEEIQAESCVAMPLIDHKGTTVGVMGVIHRKLITDVAVAESTLRIFAARAGSELERKRFEEDLAAEKERLAVTLRSIGDGVITIDQEGRVVLLNSVAEELTGWTQTQAFGQPLTKVFHLVNERTRQPLTEALEKLIASGSPVGMEGTSVVMKADGTERAVESSAAPIRDRSNRRIGVVLVFRDVTEKLRIEEDRRKAEKLESLGLAAGGIAHDFNNLLTSIIGNISLALVTTRPEEGITARLNSAKKSSIRAQELSHQLLTFAKGGAPVKTTASIGQVVRESVTFSLHGTRIKPTFDLSEDLSNLEFDPGQISQALANITINAEQAMPNGGNLWVSCSNVAISEEEAQRNNLRAGAYVRISLKDEGNGISPAYVEKIFDPYFTTREHSRGLGLATAYSILTQHDGRIDVVSTPGEGAEFILLLPASAKRQAAVPAPVREARVGTKKILVLDDEEDICMLVTHALGQVGFTVTETNDADSAIKAYREAMEAGQPFDAVISDLTIPGSVGGQEAIRQLHEIDPGVRAIVSSGYAMDPVISNYIDYGFCACISKPYEIKAMQKLVTEVVNGGSGISIVREFDEPVGAA